MADKKISALTSASTPLAGTEVLPIVQSGATVKVAVSSLTAGRDVSMAGLTSTTSSTQGTAFTDTHTFNGPIYGRYSSSFPGIGGLGMFALIPYLANANQGGLTVQYQVGNAFADGFTLNELGNFTLSTGNLVIGTSGKGIDFSATSHPAGMTSELLADYEEGTFTPVVSGSTTAGTGTYTARNGAYTKIGNTVYFLIDYILSAHTGTGDTLISGLPYAAGNSYYANIVTTAGGLSLTALYYIGGSIIAPSDTKIYFQQMPVGGGSAIGIPIDPICDVRLSGFYFV